MPVTKKLSRVADQRAALPAQQDENDAEDADYGPARRIEEAGERRVPGVTAEIGLNQRPQARQARGIDHVPEVADRRDKDGVGGDRFGAVINDQQERRGDRKEAYAAKQEADHFGTILLGPGKG